MCLKRRRKKFHFFVVSCCCFLPQAKMCTYNRFIVNFTTLFKHFGFACQVLSTVGFRRHQLTHGERRMDDNLPKKVKPIRKNMPEEVSIWKFSLLVEKFVNRSFLQNDFIGGEGKVKLKKKLIESQLRLQIEFLWIQLSFK